MSRESFEVVMAELLEKRPFEIFTIELKGGKRHQIDHPTAIAYTDGVIVFLAPGGRPHVFDHDSILQILVNKAALGV